jgi:hypothetical protein
MPPTRMAAAILLASKDMQATPRGRTEARFYGIGPGNRRGI